jgi:hypothetical protein
MKTLIAFLLATLLTGCVTLEYFATLLTGCVTLEYSNGQGEHLKYSSLLKNMKDVHVERDDFTLEIGESLGDHDTIREAKDL